MKLNLNKYLWGTYHRPLKKTPLCSAAHCYKHSFYRFTEKGSVEHYCEYHTGIFGGSCIDVMWRILEEQLGKDEWRKEQEQERQRNDAARRFADDEEYWYNELWQAEQERLRREDDA